MQSWQKWTALAVGLAVMGCGGGKKPKGSGGDEAPAAEADVTPPLPAAQGGPLPAIHAEYTLATVPARAVLPLPEHAVGVVVVRKDGSLMVSAMPSFTGALAPRTVTLDGLSAALLAVAPAMAPAAKVAPPLPDPTSGGAGTSMALEEGKMGKKEPNPTGRYLIKPNSDGQLAIDRAKAAGILGALAGNPDLFASLAGFIAPGDFDAWTRAGVATVLAADTNCRAEVVAQLVRRLGGASHLLAAVRHHDAGHLLSPVFVSLPPGADGTGRLGIEIDPSSVLVRVDDKNLIEIKHLAEGIDLDKVAEASRALVQKAGGRRTEVTLRVSGDVPLSMLASTTAALADAGIKTIIVLE